MEKFLDLPHEIQNEILKIYPETLIRAIMLAKKFPKQVARSLSELHITSKEFLEYVKTDPRTFMLFKPSHSQIYQFNDPEYDFKYDTYADIYTLTTIEHWSLSSFTVCNKYEGENNYRSLSRSA